MVTKAVVPDDADDVEEIDEGWEFGRVENPEADLPDFTPIPFKLYGYEISTKNERVFEFHARATQPFGATLDIFRKANAKGEIPIGVSVQFIYDCLVEDEQSKWDAAVHAPDVYFDAEAIAQMAKKLISYYGGSEFGDIRPTTPRAARRAGQRRTGGTSKVAHSNRVTTSSRSTRTKP